MGTSSNNRHSSRLLHNKDSSSRSPSRLKSKSSSNLLLGNSSSNFHHVNNSSNIIKTSSNNRHSIRLLHNKDSSSRSPSCLKSNYSDFRGFCLNRSNQEDKTFLISLQETNNSEFKTLKSKCKLIFNN